jgi:hypothetical protein
VRAIHPVERSNERCYPFTWLRNLLFLERLSELGFVIKLSMEKYLHRAFFSKLWIRLYNAEMNAS